MFSSPMPRSIRHWTCTWCTTTRRARTTARASPSRASSWRTSPTASTATRRRREESAKLSSVSWRAPNRGGHALPGARHQRHGAATPLRHRPVDGEDGLEDTEEPVQDGLLPRPRPLPLHRPWPIPSVARTLPAGGADALAEGHRLVPQNLTHLSEQDTQRNDVRNKSRGQEISPHRYF